MQQVHIHTSIILHTDYIHDKYNIDYIKYKHTHTYQNIIHTVSPERLT